jgi:hypothetical protein
MGRFEELKLKKCRDHDAVYRLRNWKSQWLNQFWYCTIREALLQRVPKSPTSILWRTLFVTGWNFYGRFPTLSTHQIARKGSVLSIFKIYMILWHRSKLRIEFFRHFQCAIHQFSNQCWSTCIILSRLSTNFWFLRLIIIQIWRIVNNFQPKAWRVLTKHCLTFVKNL